jgi:hypothetical protein
MRWTFYDWRAICQARSQAGSYRRAVAGASRDIRLQFIKYCYRPADSLFIGSGPARIVAVSWTALYGEPSSISTTS